MLSLTTQSYNNPNLITKVSNCNIKANYVIYSELTDNSVLKRENRLPYHC